MESHEYFGTSYYEQLLEKIELILSETSFEIQEQRQLHYCVREAICELVNRGVSKSHIYNLTQNKLFSAVSPDDDKEYIMGFLRSLTPKESKYHVVFGITDKTFSELSDTVAIMRVASQEEKEKLNADHVISIELNDYDPVSALEDAKATILVLLNVYNAFVHSDEITVMDSGLVRREDEKRYKKINSPSSVMRRNKVKPKEERISLLKKAFVATRSDSIASSFELHNIAVTSNNPETQLLMLWTVFELLIETTQDTMSKVNYITNAVSAVLCNKYYYHIFYNMELNLNMNYKLLHHLT